MYTAYDALPLTQIVARLKKYHSEEDCLLVERAYHFAEKAHEGQVRKSGEPYFIHPCYVASILTELLGDPSAIAAGYLHDTVEDCEGITQDVIRHEFGDEVAQLVDGVTKLNKLDFTDREEAQAESLRKMILAMSKDIRVVLIKLADRLHNMKTLKFQARERQVAIARETLDIYAPLAHRLGVYAIKSELEDLSLLYIDPEGYRNLVNLVGQKRTERQANVRKIIEELSSELDKAGMHYDIDGRPKHFYSIYRKMVLQNKTFDQIYDLFAVRVLVDTKADCYAVLGIVHSLWTQVPGRFKDYISVAKENGYQSLHTTVNGGRTLPCRFEVQIRTWEMHRRAEFGVAAHWRYKEGTTQNAQSALDQSFEWVRHMVDWQNETHDSREFMDTLKTDLISEEVCLFTPKGDVISMPKGATALDFAYRIHSGVGNKCVGAKVNGRIVTLDTELSTGDTVEIMTSASSKGPSTDWLRICHTPQAKAKIRQFLRKELHEEHVILGKSMIDRECKRRGAQMNELFKPEYFQPILEKYALDDADDILGCVGFGNMSAMYVVSRLMEEQRAAMKQQAPVIPPPREISQSEQKRRRQNALGIILDEDIDIDMPVRIPRCCSPVPGDDIVGYITRGRGLTVHKADCINAINSEHERMVPLLWPATNVGTFSAAIKIVGYDHMGMLGEIASYIGEMGVFIQNSASNVDKNGISTFRFVLEVHSREQMDGVIRQLKRRSDVIDVLRVNG